MTIRYNGHRVKAVRAGPAFEYGLVYAGSRFLSCGTSCTELPTHPLTFEFFAYAPATFDGFSSPLASCSGMTCTTDTGLEPLTITATFR